MRAGIAAAFRSRILPCRAKTDKVTIVSKAEGLGRTRERCDRCSKVYHSGESRYVLNFESFVDIDIDGDEDEEACAAPDGFDDTGIESEYGLHADADEPHADDLEERVRLVVCKGCHDAITSSFKKILAKRVSAPSHHVH